MGKTLDFNKLKKQYMTVTLADENNTVLMIGTPTKAILDNFLSLKDSLSAENMGDDAIDELYDICTQIMNRNKTGVKVTKAMVYELFDFEDIIYFIRGYSEFISEVSNSKNS